MGTRNYWLDLFTPKTWAEFLAAGATVTGFREGRWSMVQRIERGDYLLCYMTGVSRFVGVLEVTGPPYRAGEPKIWAEDSFPSRLPVRVVAQLPVEAGVQIKHLGENLSIFRNLKAPHAWTGSLRGSPARWNPADGEVIVEAIQQAVEHPVIDPPDPRKLRYRQKGSTAGRGGGGKLPPVTPPPVTPDPPELPPTPDPVDPPREPRSHTEIQWRLLKLGSDMRLDVWVARNDRSAEYQGQRLGDVPRMRGELPRQFEDRTTRLIELIDVLWLRGGSIVAAFEIESTTSIYSGLLRMSDLLALQPNINIPLYLVAPDERRPKVESELNRPTFNRLHPPLKKVCRYLSFSVVREHLPTDERLVRNLDPKFLDEFSESLAQD